MMPLVCPSAILQQASCNLRNDISDKKIQIVTSFFLVIRLNASVETSREISEQMNQNLNSVVTLLVLRQYRYDSEL
jgi:hypothetical protein